MCDIGILNACALAWFGGRTYSVAHCAGDEGTPLRGAGVRPKLWTETVRIIRIVTCLY